MTNRQSVSSDDLRAVLRAVDDADAALRIAAALVYRELDDVSQNEAAALFGYSSGWASKWFRRLERLENEPYEAVVFDRPRPGRPAALSPGERESFRERLASPPVDCGLEAPEWTPALARRYLLDTFDVEYSIRHVRRLMNALDDP